MPWAHLMVASGWVGSSASVDIHNHWREVWISRRLSTAVLVGTGPGFSRKAHVCTLTLEVLSTPRLYYSGEIVKDNHCLRVLMRDERFPAHVFADVNLAG